MFKDVLVISTRALLLASHEYLSGCTTLRMPKMSRTLRLRTLVWDGVGGGGAGLFALPLTSGS